VTFLLDVNVLIALIDPAHISHDSAHHWFESVGKASWATCPITENGVIRIVGHASYPNTPGSTADVAAIMAKMCGLPGHMFWPDSLSLTDTVHVDASQVLTSGQVTDTYLLALARANGGKLATFDRRLSIKAVKGGKETLQIIDNS
jgi:toxin-antitoxin system PIN domain toxin